MKCPKCESDNTFQISTGQNICRDCENIFTLDKPFIKQNNSSSRKESNPKQYLIKSSIGILLVGGIAGFLVSKININLPKNSLPSLSSSPNSIPSRDETYICSEEQTNEAIKKINTIIQDWDDAQALASSTSRINLAFPVSKMQDIQKGIRNLEIPLCAKPVINQFLNYTEDTIDQYFMFMQGASSGHLAEIQYQIKVNEEIFLKLYSNLKEGKSNDPIKIMEVSKEIRDGLYNKFPYKCLHDSC